jgi:hypothetical protein
MRTAVCPAGPARQCADHGAHRHSVGAAPQKQSLHASECDTERVQQARAAYREEIAALAHQRFKCIDESGVTLAMTRLYGRAPRGSGASGPCPRTTGRM